MVCNILKKNPARAKRYTEVLKKTMKKNQKEIKVNPLLKEKKKYKGL